MVAISFPVAEECCWGLVDSSTENLLQVPPLHSLEPPASAPVNIPSEISAAENVQVCIRNISIFKYLGF